MRVLVIEDNERIANRIRRRLEEEGYAVDVAHEGHRGEQLAAAESYDAIILDVLLPDQDGLRICQNLRRRRVDTPILMLTVLATTKDKVTGLDAGADDYLAKPFEADELVARVRALFRRSHAGEGAVLRFQNVEMDLTRRKVTRGSTPIELTTKEFALLEYFMRNPNRVLTRTAIGEHVWDMNFEDESNVIEVYVSRLRKKLTTNGGPPLIRTVTGSGYILSDEGE